MRMIWLAMLLMPGMVVAQDWVRQDDAGITAALSNRTLRYDAHTIQYFSADGATQYITERAADGRWDVRAGQYCSVWLPSDLWACFDVYVAGDQVQFVGRDQSVSTGAYAK